MNATTARQADDLLAVHDIAARFYQQRLPGSWAQDYLRHRGFGDGVQERWQAGYAPAAWDALTRHLRQAACQDALILAAGLARRSRRGTLIDTFRDRVMLPVRAANGRIVAFTGRAGGHAGSAVPRYLNSPGTAVYSKSRILFGLAEAGNALAAGAVPVIAEGPLDVLAVASAGAGRYAPVAPCGTALTAGHVAALDRACDLGSTGVLVAFDADLAGRRAAVSAYHLLGPAAGRVGAVAFPPGTDPAQVLRERGPAGLADVLERRRMPLADLVVNAEIVRWKRWLAYDEGRIGALRAIAPVIAAMPPPDVARQVSRLAARLRLDSAAVTEAVTSALRDSRTPAPASAVASRDLPAGAAVARHQGSDRGSPRPAAGPAGLAARRIRR